MKRAATIFAILLLFTGCYTMEPAGGPAPRPDPLRVIKCKDKTIATYGADARQHAAIMLAAIRMPPKLRLCVDFISMADPDHMRTDAFGGQPAGGHPHLRTNSICVNNYYYRGASPDLAMCVWHEATHMSTYELRRKDIGEWEDIAEDVYTDDFDKRWDDSEHYPRNGVLTSYGATNAWEDIAEYVEHALGYLVFYRANTPWVSPFGMSNPKHKDPRIAKKLAWLHKHGFLSQEDYLAIMKSPLLAP
jgi:hypothetical protein